VAAHEQARRLDPGAQTGVAHTYFMMGDYERALQYKQGTSDPVIGFVLTMMGRTEDAVARLKEEEQQYAAIGMRSFSTAMRAAIEGDRAGALAAVDAISALQMKDPEAVLYMARILAYIGEQGRALSGLASAVDNGFFCVSVLMRDPWLDPLRSITEFTRILRRAEIRQREARTAFLDARGDRVLGISMV
jgi:hypothetical protein